MGQTAFFQSHAAYERRRPEESALYRVVTQHLPAFVERVDELGGLPAFVTAEFDKYLRCGLLEHGCLHLECRHCGDSKLVAFSCKGRSFCPSCCGRRMLDTSVHLEQNVFPEVPVRHWICSLPWGLRTLLGYDSGLCAKVMATFVNELSRSLKKRAKKLLGLRSVSQAQTGAVCAVQRTDSALRLNVHSHVLALDGVYVRDPDGQLKFHTLPTPTAVEVAEVASRTASRIDILLKKSGRSLDPQQAAESGPEQLSLEQPAWAACLRAAAAGVTIGGKRAGRAILRFTHPSAPAGSKDKKAGPSSEQPAAVVRGINIYAKQCVDGRDRPQLERLCRYITRPPIKAENLRVQPDGLVTLTLKSAWKDGTTGFQLHPFDLLARLVSAVPPPRFNMLRYFGLFSSRSKDRAEVVPNTEPEPGQCEPPPASGDQLTLASAAAAAADDDEQLPKRAANRWAWAVKHVWGADLDACEKCGGPMRWVEVADNTGDALRLMAKFGLAPRPPPAAVPTPPGDAQLNFNFAS